MMCIREIKESLLLKMDGVQRKKKEMYMKCHEIYTNVL